MKRLICEVCQEPFDHPIVRGPNPRKCQRPECRVVKLDDRRGSHRTPVEIGRERLDVLWRDGGATVVLTETVRAAVRAGEMQGTDRQDVGRAALGFAKAVGQDGNYEAALELAACALAFAARIRPVEGAPARPDYEAIPEKIAEGERLLARAA